MAISSLYSICLDILATHADSIEDLSNVPFDPFICDLLQVLFKRPERQLQKSSGVLEKVGRVHGGHVVQLLPPNYTTIEISKRTFPGTEAAALHLTSQLFPRFVCYLNLSNAGNNIDDSSIYLLKEFVNLTVLDISGTRITDAAIASVSRLANLDSPAIGLKRLSKLGAAFTAVSDRALKHLVKIPRLSAVDLTATHVTPTIARKYLAQFAFDPREEKHISWDTPGPLYITELLIRQMNPVFVENLYKPSHQKRSSEKTAEVLSFSRRRDQLLNTNNEKRKPPKAQQPVVKRQRRESFEYLGLIESELLG